MLSNHETRERMRCKLVENLQFDSHFEASRLRDCSGYGDTSTVTHIASNNHQQNAKTEENDSSKLGNETDTLAQKLQLNKEAINTQINEDFIGDEEFGLQQQANSNQQQANQTNTTTSESSTIASRTLSRSSSIGSSIASNQTTTTNINSVSTYNSSVVGNKAGPQEYEAFLQLEEKEKLIIRNECELITVTRVIKGRFELTNKYIYFFDTYSSFYFEQGLNESNDNSAPSLMQNTANTTSQCYNSMLGHNSFTATSAGFSCHDFDILNDFKIPLTQLKEVQLRRYNLRRSALEFFLINGSNFFINFNKAVSI